MYTSGEGEVGGINPPTLLSHFLVSFNGKRKKRHLAGRTLPLKSYRDRILGTVSLVWHGQDFDEMSWSSFLMKVKRRFRKGEGTKGSQQKVSLLFILR